MSTWAWAIVVIVVGLPLLWFANLGVQAVLLVKEYTDGRRR